ncbi:Protein JOKA2 [Psilocybe cubensis]|uniref:Protein JOKA2 n=1 Tax=Psilocybe cubensis TaxID=181762 RepID=A0ACB8HGJ6_PSICU|nr:Protein JOKA2 [Psilocybe cubensis]KAH9486260.1 Protein JOKA2 [Psilocybe cubensis]
MFTIKITYRGLTRRHTFPDTNTFPSYDDISTQPSRILIGKEVHNAYEYNKCIRQFRNRSWPHAMLRFTIIDVSSRVAETTSLPTTSTIYTRFPPVGPRVAFSSANAIESQTNAMDVDSTPAPSATRSVSMRQTRPQPVRPAAQRRASDVACCSAKSANEDMRVILTEFKDIVDSALATNLSMMTNGSNTANEAPPPSCDSCHIVDKPAGFCLSNMGTHQMKLASASDARGSNLPIPHLPTPWDRFMTGPPSSSTPQSSSPSNTTPQVPVDSSNPTPVVHVGIICDVCNKVVEGVRHKCLDCPDYDLCDSCIGNGAAEAHNPFHEFFDILEPGRVIVHTVFNGDSDRETARPSQRRSSASASVPAPEPAAPSSPAVHPATCDLCESRIIGNRYTSMLATPVSALHRSNILDMLLPDFKPLKIMSVRAMSLTQCITLLVMAVTNQFMVADSSCEALPIPVHPPLHPMLKMRLPESVIPTVYRVGERQVIPETTPRVVTQVKTPVAESPASKPTVPPKSPVPVPTEPLVNPFLHDDERVKTPTPSAKPSSPIKASPAKPPPVPPKPEMISHASWASIPGFFGSSAQWEIRPPHPYEHYPPVSDNLGDIFQPKASLGNPFADIPLLNVSTISAAPTFGPVPKTTPNLPPVASSEITLPTVPNHTPMNPWPTTNAAERQELLQLIANASGSHGPPVVPAEQTAKPLTPPAPPVEHLVSIHEISDSNPEPSSKSEKSQTVSPRDFSNLSLSHLLHDLEDRVASLKANSDVDEDKLPSVTGSSLSEEALLKRPTSEPSMSNNTLSYPPSLAHLIAELPTLVPKAADVLPPSSLTTDAKEATLPLVPLSASFIEDVTVPDGQVFPPGAEFVKCWRLRNDSTRDWPESTQLVFVAGESLATQKGELAVELGKVEAGKEIDVWTGELKAPEGPGRYVGYWRLKANGELFGSSLWIEINVVEADHHSSDESSMAASSVIMPQSSAIAQDGASRQAVSSTVQSAAGDTSTISTEDDLSDAGSDISLISMPSSPSDDEDEGLFHDSRSFITAESAAAASVVASSSRTRSVQNSRLSSAMDYVLLYDDTSSSED